MDVPQTLLNQLIEHSIGGFILVAIDDKGSPKIYYKYESEVSAIALENYTMTWLNSVSNLRQEMSDDVMRKKFGDEEE